MKFVIKKISNSRTECRIALQSISINDQNYFLYGSNDGTFPEGSVRSEFIPLDSAIYYSPGPNPGIIRLAVAFLKDTIGTNYASTDFLLVTENNSMIPILNIAIDDINLINLTSDTIPTMVVKLFSPLPEGIGINSLISLEKQIITSQLQEVYYIDEFTQPDVFRGLDYDSGKLEEIGNQDLKNLNLQSYNQLTSSFKHTDETIVNQIISQSNLNLKVDYSDYKNHVHFGSATQKLKNFKTKVEDIENNLIQISKSLATSSFDSVSQYRKSLFDNIQNIKNDFTPYEKSLYYKSDTLGYKNHLNLGPNYINTTPLQYSTPQENVDGIKLIYKVSGSNEGSKKIDMFDSKYKVEDKPFYNYSGSFYLSFLMKGDESINGNIKWANKQLSHVPKIPYDTLYTSSILQPTVTSESWRRYIFQASQSYWRPSSTNPIVGTAGTITNFGVNSNEVELLENQNVTGSYKLTLGSRYTNLCTTVTSSGNPVVGTMVPAGELFGIYVDTDYSSAVTSSYLTDVKITKYNPLNTLPFSEIYQTGSNEFKNWYNDQYTSASSFDRENPHALINTLPAYLGHNNDMDNETLQKFVNMMGEHFDLTKNYVDGYPSLFKSQYGDLGDLPDKLLPSLANNSNWQFMLPFGGKSDADMLEFLGSTISNINNTSNIKNNIWKNIVNNLKYIYKSKGTQRSIRALLNSYGFPPDVLKIKEHGASSEKFEDSILSNDISTLPDGISKNTGNISFQKKEEDLVSYIFDNNPLRTLRTQWNRDSVDADSIEFVFKPVSGSLNNEILLNSSGSVSQSLWRVQLEPSGTVAGVKDSVKSRLSFILNNTSGSSGPITASLNVISMSTDYLDFKNGSYWNVLLQRTAGSNLSYNGSHLLTSHSYQLVVGEQQGDKLRVFTASSMSLGGSVYSSSQQSWLSTGSRLSSEGGNLVIGETFTGSMAEIRTWKYPLSMSVFKQHIYDKKSFVGNSLTASMDDLIYHYRLNENYKSGSSNDFTGSYIKDSNPKNIKDYSIELSNISASMDGSELYNKDVYDRIQFNINVGGAYEVSDNNILITPDKRLTKNLNPFEPNSLDVYDPLINKRKASSIIELTRSPQEVINDFILNQLGNFDFNDKFADPADINKESYIELERFAKKFFDHYDISMDVNKYIAAQASIFSQELINSLKRLIPARAEFGKVGVELKPTFLERQKIQNNKLEKEYVNFQGTIPMTDWEKNRYSYTKIVNLEPPENKYITNIAVASHTGSTPSLNLNYDEPKTAIIPISSHTGSIVKNFTLLEPLYQSYDATLYNLHDDFRYNPREAWDKNKSGYVNFVLEHNKTKDGNIALSSHTGSIVKNFTSLEPNYDYKNSNIPISSHTGSILNFTSNEPLYEYKKAHIPISSNTGSLINLSEEVITTKDGNIALSSHTGSIVKNFTSMEKLYSYNESTITISSHTGSIVKNFTSNEPLPFKREVGIPISSHTGSVINLSEYVITTKDGNIPISSNTGSIIKNFTSNEPLHKSKDGNIPISSHTGSIIKNFTSNESLYKYRNSELNIASHTGSILNLTQEVKLSRNGNIPVSSETGSVYNFSKLEPLYKTYENSIAVSSNTGSIVKNFTSNESGYDYHTYNFDFTSEDTGSKWNFTPYEKIPKVSTTELSIASSTGSILNLTQEINTPKEGDVYLYGNTSLYEHIHKSSADLSKKWGTSVNDVHFLHMGYAGVDGDYNTYHYENRYVFHALGDVEVQSGSYKNGYSFVTDWDGTLTNGVFTASGDFGNERLIRTSDCVGLRPLGTTTQLKYSGSVSIGAGKFIDETHIYPPNHIYIVGTSRDSIDRLIYKGTQNIGGEKLEQEPYIDHSDEAFYFILQTGGEGFIYQEGGVNNN